MKRTISQYAMVSTVAACTVLAACQKKGDVAATDTTVAPAPVAASGMDTTASGGAVSTKKDWTDGQIFAFAAAANTGEIKAARLAEKRGTTAAVKSFAHMMVVDHSKMQGDGKALATKLAVTPDTTKDEVTDLDKSAADDMMDLNKKKMGKDWDEDYIEKQVGAHQKVLDGLQDASKSATNPQLKDMLSQAIGKVQEHLTKAKNIKDVDLKS